MSKLKDETGFGAVEALLAIVIVCSVAVLGWYVERSLHGINSTYNSTTKTSNNTSPKFGKNKKSLANPMPTNPYIGWKTYTSTVEKVTFKYPTTWTVDTTDEYSSNDPNNTDFTALKSPDGKVIVRWTSLVDGIGDEYGTSYPLNDVINKTPIAGASGDYVVTGTTTLDGTTYYPWMAVESTDSGILSSGVAGNLDLFMGRNNINSTTNKPDTALFSTAGPRTNEGITGMPQAQAKAFLSSTYMQQAKLILLSMAY